MVDRTRWSLWLCGAGLLCLCVLAAWPRAALADPAVDGAWSAPINFPLVPVHATVLPNGKVLFWPRHGGGTIEAYVWDPIANTFLAVFNGHTNLFCSGHTLLSDGRVLVTGGHHFENDHGEPHTNFFDYNSNAWVAGPNMAGGRWYPSTITLQNGEVLTASGGDLNGDLNELPEVWSSLTNGWRSLTAAQFPLPYYPWLFTAPRGQVFCAGPEQVSQFLTTASLGQRTPGPLSSEPSARSYGSPVMYDVGKILIVGGGAVPVASADVIDLNAPLPAWQPVTPMAVARRQHNATVLPDGTVLVTGGTNATGFNNPCGAQYAAESFAPATGEWTTLASAQTPRLYHSVAALLPDARVMVGGGTEVDGHNEDPNCLVAVPDEPSVELFSPPYLFRGPRPVISAAPLGIRYKTSFKVSSPDASRIASVAWIRLSSVTHSINLNQRFMRLSFRRSGTTLKIRAPRSTDEAPPGHYMLFLVDTNGVPSVASIMRIERHSGGEILATPNPIPVCDGSGSGATALTWQAFGTKVVEVRRDAPDGPLVAHGGATGNVEVPGVSSGTIFFLQDVAGGVPLTATYTLQSVTVTTSAIDCTQGTGTLTASPNPVPVCAVGGANTTLTWSSANTTTVELHTVSPNGPLFLSSGPGTFSTILFSVGSATTFYLQDRTGGRPLSPQYTLASVTIDVTQDGCVGGTAMGSITATPNPIATCPEFPGSAVLSWTSSGTTQVEVRGTAADGPVFVSTGPGDYSITLYSVTDPVDFYLQDRSNGLPATAANTLGVVHILTTPDGCGAGALATPAPAPPSCQSLGPDGLNCWLRTALPPAECPRERSLQTLRASVLRGLRFAARAGHGSSPHNARRRRRVRASLDRALARLLSDARLPKTAGCTDALGQARGLLPGLFGAH